jgi:hypothetical protein
MPDVVVSLPRANARATNYHRPVPAALIAILVSTVSAGESSQPKFEIAFATEQGSGSDGRRHIELRGAFEGAADARVQAICNGRPVPAAVVQATDVRLTVSIPEPPGRTHCTFTVVRMTDGVATIPSEASTLQLKDPVNEITGSRDLGVAGGRHEVELWGAFATPASLDATHGVTCNAMSAGNVRQRWAGDHFQVSFDDVGEARCSFVFGYGDGRRTNLWGPLDLRPHAPLSGFGTYVWSTETKPQPGDDDAIESSVRPLFRAGFDVVRVQMAPNWRLPGVAANHYKFNVDLFNGECPPGVPFLPCAARTRAFQRLASSPSARVVMMTVADSASDGLVYTEDTWRAGSPVRAAVVQEYRDLALALYETASFTGKTFIISSYESDNDLYCGCGVLGFVSDADGCRTKCEEGDLPHWKRMGLLREWFQARHDGIQMAGGLARSRGIVNVVVADAIEISSIRWLHNTKTCRKVVKGQPVESMPHCPNILDDVVPAVQPSYVSWSAWEGIRDDLPGNEHHPFAGTSATSMPGRTPRLDADLADLKARLTAMPGSPQLIVGEFGVEPAPDLSRDTFSWANGEIAKSIQRARLPVNVAWSGYDSVEGTLQPYGLFNTDGSEKSGMVRLRQALTEGAAEMAALPNPSARIMGIVVSAVREGAADFDLFEVFGAFPAPPQSAADISLICNGSRVTAPDLTWLGATPTQVNFRIRHDNAETLRYCSVKLPGAWTHGPKKLWPGRCPRAVCQ